MLSILTLYLNKLFSENLKFESIKTRFAGNWVRIWENEITKSLGTPPRPPPFFLCPGQVAN